MGSVMGFFIESAWAQDAGAQGDPLFSFFLPLIIFIAVFYFLLIRPQQKRAKEHQAMVSSLAVGNEVVTTGGILGRIEAVGSSFITLLVAPDVRIKVQINTIARVVPSGTVDSE